MVNFTESTLEEAFLDYIASLGWQVAFGPDIAPGELAAERDDYLDVLLARRLQTALARLNPSLPPEALEDAFRKISNIPHLHPSLGAVNHTFHKMLTDGVDVEYRHTEGHIAGDKAWLIDFTHPENNDFFAVNQFTVIEHKNRRPDVVLFVNGLPLIVVELKNPTDENADTHKAYRQIQTYKRDIPSLFAYNEIVILSDGVDARAGTFLSPWERFMPWRTIHGQDIEPASVPQIEVLTRGILQQNRFLDILHYFIVFSDENGELKKKLAAYHQFHAVNVALEETIQATSSKGDRRIGVVWHTQGSGKSLTMAFYAGRAVLHPKMQNPTLVIITDRNDLDDQLFETFVQSKDMLRQTPIQADSRTNLRELLQVASGGVVFTTMQKFLPAEKGDKYPLLSERSNIVVIADEAHRSQYGFIEGMARNLRDALPNASFIGFTGTPVELGDRNTRHVFGDYISIYDVERAIEDKVTVPILYEARLAKIELNQSERPHLDTDFEEVTEGEESFVRERLATKWSRLESMVGTDKRLKLLAADIIRHFEVRQEVMVDGKGMVVAMSRRIAVELYNQLITLRPDWHNLDDTKGALKIVMTGSASDPLDWQTHIRNKAARKEIEKRFKAPDDPLKLVIVRDMWLTGFDVPALHTMYLDKPMKGHTLMQAIARVNRVFRDKPGGLVVDYLGIAQSLREALSDYTESGGKGTVVVDQNEAVAILLEKHEILTDLFEDFDYSPYFSGSAGKRLAVIPQAMEHILTYEDGKSRLLKHVSELSKAFALAVPHPEALRLQDEVGFFQALRAGFVKTTAHRDKRTGEDLDHAVRQIISKAIAPEGVVDIFAAAGLDRPDISILSDEFLEGIKELPQKNLAVELLQRLLNDEIKIRLKTNLVRSRAFSERLEEALRRYQNRTVEATEVIMALIQLAQEMKEADARGETLGLDTDEIAFYDALAENKSAVDVLGDDKLVIIAREVLHIVRDNTTIDWTVKESVRANLRRLVKRILRKYGYPPDMQEKATQTVLKQAEFMAGEWV
jgi:type I restriction enzyme, R subunit